MMTYEIRLFSELNGMECFDSFLQDISKEINGKTNDYVLNVNIEEWRQYFISKHQFSPIVIDMQNIKIELSNKSTLNHLNTFEYHLKLKIPFTGSAFLLKLRPSTYHLSSPNVTLIEGSECYIVANFSVQEQAPSLVEMHKKILLDRILPNVPNINKDVERFNQKIGSYFDVMYLNRKNAAIKENLFFEAINIDVDSTTDKIFKVPIIEKKKIPEPIVDKKSGKKFSETPIIDDKFYDDVLEVINSFYKSVEKRPSIFSTKDEEALRDYILPTLEVRYKNTTSTGETFNKGGKTDILIKHTDGTNLFIAECKFWRGKEDFLKAINQLFDRYLTWRDSKVALLFFIENKEPSKVLEVIKSSVVEHPYYLRENGTRGESSFSYVFHFPNDKNKLVFTEIMVFHFPKQM